MSGRLARWVAMTWIAHVVLALGTFALIRLADRSGLAMFAPLDREIAFADVPKYFEFANRTAAGSVPYRDFRVEYPPLALPFLLVPRLVTSSQSWFVMLFAAEMLVFDGLLIAAVARFVQRTDGEAAVPGRLLWLTAGFAMLSPFVMGRYDIVPALIGFVAAVAWFSGRSGLGGGLAGLGVLVKLVPGAVAMIGVLGEFAGWVRPRGRGTVAFLVVMAAGLAAWFGLGGRGVVTSLRYHSERGIEIGSLPCGPLWTLAKLRGSPIAVVQDHESLNLVTDGTAAVADRAVLIQAGTLAIVAGLYLLGRGRDPLRFAAAAVLAFVIGGKVLSPQYLLWVLPFAVALRGRAGRVGRPLFLVAALLTMLLYPWGTVALRAGSDVALLLVNIRNLALVILGAAWLILPSGEQSAESGEIPGRSRPLKDAVDA